MRLLTLCCLLASTMATAQPMTAATTRNVGAGFGFTYLLGLNSLTGGAFSLGAPAATLTLERRVGDRTFVTFEGSLAFGTNQNDTAREFSNQAFAVNGQLGVRRVLNPGGLIEVSWFASGRGGWSSTTNRQPTTAVDPSTGLVASTVSLTNNRAFSVGAVAGLALERELIEGLALRFSSSIVGVGYSQGSLSVNNDFVNATYATRGVDIGLRFSPSLEVRFAF